MDTRRISALVVPALLASTAITIVLAAPRPAAAQTVAAVTDQSVNPAPAATENAALRARIRELEAENRALRQKTGQQRPAKTAANAPAAGSSSMVQAANAAVPANSPATHSLYAMAAKAPPVARGFDWAGPYAGISLGLGGLDAKTATTESFIDTSTSLPSPPGGFTTDRGTDVLSGKSRAEVGAVADLYIGYNYRLSPTWLAGVQIEGSLGRFFGRFNQSGTTTNTEFSNIGPISSTTGTFSQNDTLNINFMVSALARLGYLVTPRDLVYGIGGWTFAGFNTSLPNGGGGDPSFGANGVTIGAGWERQILDSWTLKLEYRFTKFETINVATGGTFSETTFSGGVPSSLSQFFDNASTSVSPSLHVVRVGLTHYFGDEGAGPASGRMYMYAPAPAYAWTGFYTGFSLGVGGTHTKATTNNSSTFTETGPTGISELETGSSTATSSDTNWLKPGGVADLIFGYNQQRNMWVGGLQIEGSLARFNERLTQNETETFSQSSGPPLTLVDSEVQSFTQNLTLTANWMVSALGRLGYLVDSRNMIYGLGGWTFAGFSTTLESETNPDRTFTSNGPTVGLGWERQIADLWSFRAEYRYTKFLDRTLTSPENSASSTVNGGVLETATNSGLSATKISSDMHVVRFGLVRQLNLP